MTNNLEGKVVAVIGASSGIGQGIAEAVAEQSPKALILAARRKNLLEELAQSLKETNTYIIQTDVTSEESIKSLINTTITKYGHLDIVVNSAGVIQKETLIENLDSKQIDTIIDTNLRQVLYVAKHLAHHFKAKGSGTYLIISSQAGKYPFSGETAYNASKSGADHLIRALNEEWKEHENIHAISLGPGFINTEEAKRKFPEVPAEVWNKSPSPLEFGRTVISYILNPKEKINQGGPVHLIETAKY